MNVRLLAVVLALAVAPAANAAGVVVVLAGGVTAQRSTVLPPPVSLTKVTEKNYVVLDLSTGNYQRFRLFKVGALKKYALSDSGTVLGQVLPGNAQNSKTDYLYFNVTNTDSSFPGFTTDTRKGWQEWKGVASVAAGTDINLTYPFPPSLKLLRRVMRTYTLSFGAPIPNEVYYLEETGTLTIVRPLSKAANDAGEALAAAVVRLQAFLVSQGYQL
jgi:hypothetical protein